MKQKRIHIGLRTIKTAAAATIAMLIVNSYGTSSSKLIFAMLGAMTAMEPTFKDSLKSCLTQIVGVLFGCLIGVLLLMLPLHPLVAAVIGMIVVITLYNFFRLRFSPSLPCLIVILLCTTPDIQPFTYALGRCWDTAIGLGVGMLINILIFPYDNSRQIRATAESLDKELISFLEDMFGGNSPLPDTEKMAAAIDKMESQLQIFSKQRFLFHRQRRKQDYDAFWACEGKARLLIAQMEVLCTMESPGRLSEENRRRLEDSGADIRDMRNLDTKGEICIVTNYHVKRILELRQELLEALGI
ncbi:MAG: aromatic acid exporter family protein [Lachnospiraceae bacterium]